MKKRPFGFAFLIVLLMFALTVNPCFAAEGTTGSTAEKAAAAESATGATAEKAAEEPEPPVEPRIPDQWVEHGDHLRLRAAGGKYRKGFALRRGSLHFFDSNGNLQTGWISFGGKTYYASRMHGERGRGEIMTGLVRIDRHYYLLDPDSTPVSGAMYTGFHQEQGNLYYFHPDGRLATGWFMDSGCQYYAQTGRTGDHSDYGAVLAGVQHKGGKTYRFAPWGILEETMTAEPAGPFDPPAGFRPIIQYPDLPTGCETTSLTMVLNYLGYPVDKLDLADHYLDKKPVGEADFYKYFVGDPRDVASFGCYSPVIVKAGNRYLEKKGSELNARNISGSPLEALAAYTKQGIPVIVWGTAGCRPGHYTVTWEIDGRNMTWYSPEHCMVLVACYADRVVLADPLWGRFVTYDRNLFDKRYRSLHRQAVVIR